LWFFLGPLLTVLVYTFVFNGIAKISTNGIPAPLFYLTGTTFWNYFNECFTRTSTTFVSNAGIFGKVYFPRLVSPISIIFSNLLKFLIQLLMLTIFVVYYIIEGKSSISPNMYLIFLPLMLLIIGGISLGIGITISSLSTKYRDLNYLIAVFLHLLMYATPVIYPITAIPEKYRLILAFNPLSPIIENFRFCVTGAGEFDWYGFGYSAVFMLIVLFIGLILFNKTEKSFMDTV
jgi:lipopolysaccharide transport system permease protein